MSKRRSHQPNDIWKYSKRPKNFFVLIERTIYKTNFDQKYEKKISLSTEAKQKLKAHKPQITCVFTSPVPHWSKNISGSTPNTTLT